MFIAGDSDVNSSYSLDHFAVLCYLNVNRPKTIHKSVKFRACRNIPVPDYRNDVKLLMCNRRKPQKNIDDLINNYNSTLHKLTDKYAHSNVRLSHCDPMHPGTQVHYVRRKGCASGVREWLRERCWKLTDI